MRNILVVTGGAGFIGSNLIFELLKFKKFNIISIDNYSSGLSKNHINNKRFKVFIIYNIKFTFVYLFYI